MKQELQQKLYEDFPSLFRDKDRPKEESCMFWGLEIRDGWYDLMYTLCTELTESKYDVTFAQVKEKFGGFRAYIICKDMAAQTIVDKYEELSYETCEECGNNGKSRSSGWIKVLCDDCDKKDI